MTKRARRVAVAHIKLDGIQAIGSGVVFPDVSGTIADRAGYARACAAFPTMTTVRQKKRKWPTLADQASHTEHLGEQTPLNFMTTRAQTQGQ